MRAFLLSLRESILHYMNEAVDFKRVLDLSVQTGRIMLENGAEIYRVEDTMNRIAAHYGIKEENFFVLTNGIFTTCQETGGEKLYAKVEHIPVHGAQLNKVIELNQLSRDICSGKLTIAEAEEKVQEIKQLPRQPKPLEIAATSLGAACFAILLKGTVTDALAAAIAGLLLGFFNIYIFSKYLSKVSGNILGALLVTLICLGFDLLTTSSTNMNAMVAGAVIPLVPGVAFVNGIRDIADGDYISGAVRLLDAILVFTCIAVGVAIPFILFKSIGVVL